MVFAQEITETTIEIGQRQGRLITDGAAIDVAGQNAEEHLINGREEALYAATPARLSRRGEDQPHFDVGGDLFEVRRGEIPRRANPK
jgi:hypothetical protein